MKWRVLAGVVVLGIAQVAGATNAIREWGGHVGRDYRIDYAPGTTAVGVRILANSQPTLPWKFEAYDSVTGAPGYIEYIYIDSQMPVGSIVVNVIGDPSESHTYGAEDLKGLDIVNHGSYTNVLDVIKISGDIAVEGDVKAYGATAITASGNLGPYAININGPVSGDISINGSGPHGGSLTICAGNGARYDGDIYFGGSMEDDLADIVLNADLGGSITVNGDVWNLSTHTILAGAGIDIAGDLLGHATEAAFTNELRGTIHVGGTFGPGGTIGTGAITSTGEIIVDGDAHGSFFLGPVNAGATVTVEGDLIGGFLCDGTMAGALTITGDAHGEINCPYTCTGAIEVGALSGRFLVDHPPARSQAMSGSLLVDGAASGLIAVNRLEGDIDVLGDFSGTLETGDSATPGDLTGSITLKREMSGDLAIYGDLTSGASIAIGEQASQDMTGAIETHGDLAGTVHVYQGLADPLGDGSGGHILVDGDFLSTGAINIDGSIQDSTCCVAIDYDG
jgi:hypothetical protein